MSNFVEKPICIMNDKYELTKEGEDFIKSLQDKKISPIAIIGPKSSGKSFLSNQLIGIFKNGFEIGMQNANECCTRGLWAWGAPFSKDGVDFLIFDVQGLQIETEEQINLSQKFLKLINKICSCVIYNYRKDDENENNKEISEQVIENSVNYFIKLIQNQNEKNIPNYFWVYRDYNISDISKYFDIINSKAKDCEDYNTKYKNKIKIFSLPPPMEENDMLINIYLDEEEDPFDSEYKNQINEFKKIIFNPNINNNIDISLILKSIKNFNNPNADIEININKEEIDNIENEIINELKNKLKEKNGEENNFIIKCKNSYDILSNQIFEAFIDKTPQNEYLIEKINNIINIYGSDLIQNYLQNKINEYETSLKNLITQKENTSPLINDINKKDDIKSIYDKFVEEIKKDFDEILFSSKNEFLSCFPEIKTYLEKCVFNHILKYINNITNFISVSDDANKEIQEQKQKIEEMTNEINNLKQNLESKEKELETQKQSNEKLGQEKKELIEEKNNLNDKYTNLEKEKTDLEEKNKSLESQLSEMTNKNQEIESKLIEYIEKEKAKPKPFLLNIKDEDTPKLISLFSEIQNTSKEFNETLKLFLQKKSSIFHSNFIEETKTSVENTCINWVEQLQKITKERFDSKDNFYTQEIDKLKEDKKVLNDELNQIKQDTEKMKEENNNLKEEIKLVKDIQTNVDKYKTENEKIVSTLKSTIELNEKRLKDFDNKFKDMEMNLSNYKFDSKMKEEDLFMTINIFKSMLEKNKKNFENLLKKVSKNIQDEITAINKKYKFIKM